LFLRKITDILLWNRHDLAPNTMSSLENIEKEPARDNNIALRFMAWSLGIIGIILLAISSYKYLDISGKKKDWTQIEGTVAYIIVDPSEGGAAPVVTYLWRDDSLSYTSTVYSSPPVFSLGEKVKLYVNPASPQIAFIDTFREIYFFTIILGALGIALSVIGFLVIYYIK